MQTFCTYTCTGVRSSYRLALIPLPVANQEASLHFFLSIPISFILSSTIFISSLYFSVTISLIFLPSFTYFFHFFLAFKYPVLPHFFLYRFFLPSNETHYGYF